MKICLAFEENTQDAQLIDSELYEGRAIVKDMDDAITDVDKLSKETEANERIVDILGSNDNVSVEAIQLAEINLSSLRRKLNYQSSSVSVESVRNLQIALEEEKGFLARIWDMIKAVFKWIGEKVSQFVNWVKGLFGGGKQQKIEKVIEKASDSKISLKIVPPQEVSHAKAGNSSKQPPAAYAIVSSEEQQKVLKEQSSSLSKAIQRLESPASSAEAKPLPAVRKIKDAADSLSGQAVEVTSSNVQDTLEKIQDDKNTIPLSDTQLRRLRILVQHKEEFVQKIKDSNLTPLANLRNSIISYVKFCEKIASSVDYNVVLDIGLGKVENEGGVRKTIRNRFFKDLFSENTVSQIFGKLEYTKTTDHLDHECFSFELYGATHVVRKDLSTSNSDFFSQRSKLDNFEFQAKDENKSTVLMLSSDVDFLNKNIKTITDKITKNTEALGKNVMDQNLLSGLKKIIDDGLARAYKECEKVPEEDKERATLGVKFVNNTFIFLINAINKFVLFFQKLVQNILEGYQDVSVFICHVAEVLHKANVQSDKTIDWLIGLNKPDNRR